MGRKRSEHTGDEQLVYGMPKRMVGVSTAESLERYEKKSVEKQPSDKPGTRTLVGTVSGSGNVSLQGWVMLI